MFIKNSSFLLLVKLIFTSLILHFPFILIQNFYFLFSEQTFQVLSSLQIELLLLKFGVVFFLTNGSPPFFYGLDPFVRNWIPAKLFDFGMFIFLGPSWFGSIFFVIPFDIKNVDPPLMIFLKVLLTCQFFLRSASWDQVVYFIELLLVVLTNFINHVHINNGISEFVIICGTSLVQHLLFENTLSQISESFVVEELLVKWHAHISFTVLGKPFVLGHQVIDFSEFLFWQRGVSVIAHSFVESGAKASLQRMLFDIIWLPKVGMLISIRKSLSRVKEVCGLNLECLKLLLVDLMYIVYFWS